MDRALLIICALMLNAALAGPRRWYAGLGLTRITHRPAIFVRDLERKLNRERRAPQEREFRGFLLVGVAAMVSLCAGWIATALFAQTPLIELIIVATALPVRPSWDLASRVRKTLERGDAALARQAFDDTVWRHGALLDEYGLARAAIETLAVNFSEKILAPVFWYLFFGLPGLFLSKTIYLLEETLAAPGTQAEFSKAARLAHYVFHYPTARLAALLWVIASAFLPSDDPLDVIRQLAPGAAGDAPQILSLRSAASVLRLSLGGPTSAYAQVWIGNGIARAMAADIRRALRLFAFLCLLLALPLGFFL